MGTSSWAEELYICKVIHNIQGAITQFFFACPKKKLEEEKTHLPKY
jgi:hypothetical protein